MANDVTKIAGKDIAVYVSIAGVGSYPVGCDETCDIEVTTSTITTTSKCSKDANDILWEEIVPNVNSVKVTGQGLIPQLATAGYDEVSSQVLASAQFKQQLIYFTWGISGTNLFYGMNGYITTIKDTGDYKDVAKYNYTIMGTGPINTFPVS